MANLRPAYSGLSMRHNPGIPIAVAAGAAAIGITGAALLDSTAGAVILLLVALAVVAGCVLTLRRRDGYEVRSSRDASESRWRDADRGLADRRNVFAWAELAGLDLTELEPRVREAAAPLLTERSAGQPVDRIVVVPGQFPDIDRSPATAEPGFRFSAVNTSVLLKVRADIMRRASSPPYDAALVGLAVGQAPFDRELGPVIRMNVGPSSVKTAGMYTLRGRWVADRSF